MKIIVWILSVGLLVSGGLSAWLYTENSALHEALLQAQASRPPAPECEEKTVVVSAPASARAEAPPPASSSSPSPEASSSPSEEAPPEESRAERRRRRQERLAAFLGRGPNETEEEYRNRLAPLITMGLAEPRKQLEEERREAEEAAGVTEEQKEALDAIFSDIYEEAIALTNHAIANGDLTPYRRNAAGVLTYVGGLGALLSEAETRLGEVLTEEQRALIAKSGFDWAEYLGVNAPWETLNPPPPPDTDR